MERIRLVSAPDGDFGSWRGGQALFKVPKQQTTYLFSLQVFLHQSVQFITFLEHTRLGGKDRHGFGQFLELLGRHTSVLKFDLFGLKLKDT
jgi:hypothetical protein